MSLLILVLMLWEKNVMDVKGIMLSVVLTDEYKFFDFFLSQKDAKNLYKQLGEVIKQNEQS